MDEEILGPSTRIHQSTYSDNRKTSTGIQAKDLVINGKTVIDYRRVTQNHSHFYRNNNQPEIGLIGSYNFALDDIPNILASRNVELESMRQKLEACTIGTGAKVLILVGMGGAGKTTLAKMYARNNKDDFDNLIWVDAETESSLESTFEDLMKLVLLEAESESKSETNPPNISRLHNNILKHKTLWVFDNVEDFELYKRYSPKSVPPKGNQPVIIITTRTKKGWTDLAENAVYIEKVSLEVCEQYIRQKLAGTAVPTTDIDENWAKLAQHSGSLVIALNAALTAIVERNRTLEAGGGQPLTIAAFLAQARVKSMQELDVPSDEPQVRSIYQRLRHLWTDTLEILPLWPHGPLALRFLKLMAYFPPAGVPTFWFKILARDLVTDEFEVVQALALLVSWSLADKIGDKHCVHRVLQETLLRRFNSQEIDEFLNWTVPALEKLYLELRLEGKLTGYFSCIECFLLNIDTALHFSNDTFLQFFIESLEMGIHSSLEHLEALVIQLEKEEILISFDNAKSLLKNADIKDTFPFVVIQKWFKQFESENAVQKIQLVARINWRSSERAATEIMQLVIESSQYFEDAILNSETNEEITATLLALIKLTRFVSEKFKNASTDFSPLWPQFVLTTLNLNSATGQVLQKFNSLEVVQPSSNKGIQPILIAAGAILYQLDMFQVAKSGTSLGDSRQKRLLKHPPEFRNKIVHFINSIDQELISNCLIIFEIQQGSKIIYTGVDQLTLTFEAAVAVKVYQMFQDSVKKSSSILHQILSFVLAEFDQFSAFKFTILYTILDYNLDAILRSELPPLQVDYFIALMNSSHYLSNWVSESRHKWQSKTNSDIRNKLQILGARASDISQRLELWICSFRKSNSSVGFSDNFLKTAQTFGYNSVVTYQKVEKTVSLLHPWENDYTREFHISLLQKSFELSSEEQREATRTGNCKCYPAKYQTLLAKLYFDNNIFDKAVEMAKGAFAHQLFCLRQNISGCQCTNFLVQLFYKTEDPSSEIHNLLVEILQGQLEFYGQNHIASWISYLDLATFHCLEGDVNSAINSVSEILCSTVPEHKDSSFKLMSFAETLAATSALIVYMLLWRKRPQRATDFISNFQTWFEQLGTWTKKDHPRFDNGYNQLLHILNAIALYQLERYSDMYPAQGMLNFGKLEVHYWNRTCQVRENWLKFANGTSFLNDAGIWCKRIQHCFEQSEGQPQVFHQKLRDLKTNRKVWYKTALKNEISVYFNQTVEKLLFFQGKGLWEKHWCKMIECHTETLWDLNFKFYTDSNFFLTNLQLSEYSRESVISGEVFVACLINDYKRGTIQREYELMSTEEKNECAVS